MSNFDKAVNDEGASNNPLIGYAMLLLVFSLIIGGLYSIFGSEKPPRPYVHPHIKAESYIPPVGCGENPFINTTDFGVPMVKIPSACADKKYLIDSEAYEYGLNSAPHHVHYKSGGSWYRIFNDAVQVNCGYFGVCNVSNIEFGVFY